MVFSPNEKLVSLSRHGWIIAGVAEQWNDRNKKKKTERTREECKHIENLGIYDWHKLIGFSIRVHNICDTLYRIQIFFVNETYIFMCLFTKRDNWVKAIHYTPYTNIPHLSLRSYQDAKRCCFGFVHSHMIFSYIQY